MKDEERVDIDSFLLKHEELLGKCDNLISMTTEFAKIFELASVPTYSKDFCVILPFFNIIIYLQILTIYFFLILFLLF